MIDSSNLAIQIQSDPLSKIVIFTSYLSMIRIMASMCRAEKWGYETYHGSRTQEERAGALQRFAESPNVSILIASLHAGGTGLNLTMASKCLIMDPWWNCEVERQG